MNRRTALSTALGLVVFGPAAVCVLYGCGTQEGTTKGLLSGLLLEDTASIDVVTTTNGIDANDAPGPYIEVGNQVVWLYAVTNNGNNLLTDIAVTDDQGAAVSCPATTLASGESMNCVAVGVATAGQFTNIGTATAIDPDNNTVTDSDPSNYFGGPIPSGAAIDIVASTNGEDANDPPGPTLNAGDPVEWTYVVTNNGTSDLTNVAVIDSEGVTVDCPQAALAAGESITCTASGTAVEGQYSNIGIASASDAAGDVVTDFDWSHYFVAAPVPAATIDIEVATNGDDADDAPGPTIPVGATVNWTYVVTNTSEVALTNVTVTDDQGVTVTCPATELEAGASVTCTADGSAVEGQYANVGTVTATDPENNTVTDSDPSHYLGAADTPPGDAGCGLGFWKNHLDAWGPTGYTPDQKVSTVFASVAAYPDLVDLSLLQVLRLPGGPEVKDAAGLLLKHAVAALLNAAHPDVNFALTTQEVIDLTNASLDSANRTTMLSSKGDMESDNEMGCHLGWSDDKGDDTDDDAGDDAPNTGHGHGQGHK